MSSQVSARKALKDARQGKKFCFRSDHSEGFFNDLSMLFSLVGPLVTLASQGMYPFPREGVLEDSQLAPPPPQPLLSTAEESRVGRAKVHARAVNNVAIAPCSHMYSSTEQGSARRAHESHGGANPGLRAH